MNIGLPVGIYSPLDLGCKYVGGREKNQGGTYRKGIGGIRNKKTCLF
jgi:hypothetical protein